MLGRDNVRKCSEAITSLNSWKANGKKSRSAAGVFHQIVAAVQIQRTIRNTCFFLLRIHPKVSLGPAKQLVRTRVAKP